MKCTNPLCGKTSAAVADAAAAAVSLPRFLVTCDAQTDFIRAVLLQFGGGGGHCPTTAAAAAVHLCLSDVRRRLLKQDRTAQTSYSISSFWK